MSKLPCFYAHGGLNYKNGFATTCPISGARLKMLDGQVPSEFWNNQKFREYRQMLDRGEWPSDCNLCRIAEEIDGTKSMRHDYEADLSTYNSETGEVSFAGLKHVELRFSNTCNMACLHCSEVYSSQWGSRLKNYQPDDNDVFYNLEQLTKTQHRIGDNDTTKIDIKTPHAIEIANDLVKNFPNIEKIDFAGGEVLYQKQFFPTLDALSKHPNAKNMLLFFHTNFNADFDVEKLSELLGKFGSSQIKISVDAGKNIYSYFRDGKWDKLKDNLRKFKSVNNFTLIDTVCTTSIYQIMDIENIMLSLLELDIDFVDASIVFTPHYINPALIMREFPVETQHDFKMLKNRIAALKQQRLDSGKKEMYRSYDKDDDDFTDIRGALIGINNIENYIYNHKTEEKSWQGFLHYSNKIDKLWKQDFNSVFKKYKLNHDKLERIND